MPKQEGSSHSELLVEGARSYPRALAALREFRNLISEKCRESLESDIGLVCSSMGLGISPADIIDHRNPDKIERADGDWSSVGVSVDREKDGWWLYHCVCWQKGNVELWVSLYLTDKMVAQRIFRKMDSAVSHPYRMVMEERREICLCRTVSAEDFAQLSDLLHDEVRLWCDTWAKIGTLKSFSASKAAAN